MKETRSQFKIVFGIVVVTAVVFSGMYIFRPTAPVEELEDRIERIEAVSAKRQDVFPVVNTQAVVESRFNITLKSQVSGQIVYISPKFLTGGFFDTNEVIMRIDPSDYELALVQAEVNVARAEQTLSIEREQSQIARRDWEKYGEGEPTDLVLRIPQLREAEAGLKGAQANYDTQRIRLERTEVKAPFPLMIDQKQVDLGQIVGNNQDLASIFGTEEAEIRMPLSQAQIDLLSMNRVGILSDVDQLDVKIRDFTREDNIVWDAKITRVESSIDRRSRVYYAIATVMDPMNLGGEKTTPPLLPGVFVDLEIQGPKIENVFQVPATSMKDNKNIFFFDDGKLITKPVEVLDRNEEFVTIISGLNEGDPICIAPPWSYVPGMKAELASVDGVPVGGPRGGRPGGTQRAGGGRPAAQPATEGETATAQATEAPEEQQTAEGENKTPDFASMTPEQRRAAIAAMTPEQRAALRAQRRAAGGGRGNGNGGGQQPQGGTQ